MVTNEKLYRLQTNLRDVLNFRIKYGESVQKVGYRLMVKVRSNITKKIFQTKPFFL